MIGPAVEGTLSVCRAAKLHGVKRVVITSSCAAMMINDDKNKTHVTKDSWTDPKCADTYEKSKTLAELAAWKHQKDNGNCYELATINPGLIMGVPLVKGGFASADALKYFTTSTGPFPAVPPFSLPLVDV